VVRTAFQALSAVLGGTQSLHTNSMDEALALPSEEAVRIALRTQQILAHESGLADTVDPLGGAYAVERLTDEIEEAAEAYIEKIEGMGGALHAIPFMQREVHEAAYRDQQELEAKTRIVVGVNEFVTDGAPRVGLFSLNPAIEEARAGFLARFRSRRSGAAVGRARLTLEQAARGGANLLPVILEAVKAGVSLGEICDSLREVFGSHHPSLVF